MSSVQIINSKEKISCSEAENKYKNSIFLMMDIEDRDGDFFGTIYAVSRDISSYDEILQLERKFNEQGKTTVIDGEYAPSIFNSVDLVSIRE
ncbi:MAG: hypothetical protein K2M91_07355 [Lachnospiraceae bacterium]|nr:hypothetical protein [Lachnospiraceae bacterium]